MTTSEQGSTSSPRLVRLRIRGFRSYGSEAREIELDSPITVIKGDNSQGKTATAEALEFLFTGQSSRRDLFGAAKAEYERMLANVHLPDGDTDVCLDDSRGWVSLWKSGPAAAGGPRSGVLTVWV